MTELVDAAKEGDRKALERLLAREQQRIYAFGLKMCRNPDDARDVLQETMLAVARNIGGFRGESSLQTWLFQIARSFCIKNRRKRKGEPSRSDPLDSALADAAPSPEQTTRTKELEALVNAALAKLPATAREVVVLRDVEGLTAEEVAKVTGSSVDAVKSRLHRARKSLQAAIAPMLKHPAEKKSAECPDILAMYSKQLEGDLTSAMCAKLEKHVAGCAFCGSACVALKKSLALCRVHPRVPPEVQRAVRRELRQMIAIPDER